MAFHVDQPWCRLIPPSERWPTPATSRHVGRSKRALSTSSTAAPDDFGLNVPPSRDRHHPGQPVLPSVGTVLLQAPQTGTTVFATIGRLGPNRRKPHLPCSTGSPRSVRGRGLILMSARSSMMKAGFSRPTPPRSPRHRRRASCKGSFLLWICGDREEPARPGHPLRRPLRRDARLPIAHANTHVGRPQRRLAGILEALAFTMP